MCEDYKKTSSIVEDQQAPVERVAELMAAAEAELAAFYEAVFRQYGLRKARRAAQDWIEELKTMEWPGDCVPPSWRHVTIAAAHCLQNHLAFSAPMKATGLQRKSSC